MRRLHPLVNGQVYHVISRSIAGYKIFNIDKDYLRFEEMLNYYKTKSSYKYSLFKRLSLSLQSKTMLSILSNPNNQYVQIIAYCLMPTHIHLILKQLKDNGVSVFMSNILNSYARYFNVSHGRKGPLWEGRFKSILVSTDEQLLHLTRYVHLNPSSAGIVTNPEDWDFSSYKEFINKTKRKICNYKKILDINTKDYQKFVEDRKAYQQEISKIKSILIDDYTG